MTILNLHMFIEIIKDMNLCITAERLFTTQQGLSGHIKRLETHFGVALFERTPRLALTKEGEAFVEEANKILESEQRLFRLFGTDSQLNFGNIRISCGMARSRYFMPKIISEFTSNYPSVSVNLFDENNFTGQNVLAEDKIDLVIGRQPPVFSGLKSSPLVDLRGYIMISDSLIRKTLGTEADSFIINANNGLEVCDIPLSIPMAYAGSIRREPWICEKIPELKNRPKVYVERQNYDILIGICREGKVMIIVSEMYVHYIRNTFSPNFFENIHFFPHYHNGLRFIEHEMISYNSNRYHPKYFDDFLELVFKTFKDIKDEFMIKS